MRCYGLGLGWSKDEYQASNIPFVNRGERADEFLQAYNRHYDHYSHQEEFYHCIHLLYHYLTYSDSYSK
jgi:alkanesulfonate monooxygenase SsuD/methylene tetrahydromethanopterin reductase-like flavin-dependent oxidoreductase (luciferase family)